MESKAVSVWRVGAVCICRESGGSLYVDSQCV